MFVPSCCLFGYGSRSKLNHRGTAGFCLWFHLPGFHFGYLFLTHSHLGRLPVCERFQEGDALPPPSSSTEKSCCHSPVSLSVVCIYIYICIYKENADHIAKGDIDRRKRAKDLSIPAEYTLAQDQHSVLSIRVRTHERRNSAKQSMATQANQRKRSSSDQAQADHQTRAGHPSKQASIKRPHPPQKGQEPQSSILQMSEHLSIAPAQTGSKGA